MHLEYLLVIFALHLVLHLCLLVLRPAQEHGLLPHVHPECLLSLDHHLPQLLSLLPDLLHALRLLPRAQLVIITTLVGVGEFLQVLQVVLPVGQLVPKQGVHSTRLLVGEGAVLPFGEAVLQGPKRL